MRNYFLITKIFSAFDCSLFSLSFFQSPFAIFFPAVGFRACACDRRVRTGSLTQTSLSPILRGVGRACRCSQNKPCLAALRWKPFFSLERIQVPPPPAAQCETLLSLSLAASNTPSSASSEHGCSNEAWTVYSGIIYRPSIHYSNPPIAPQIPSRSPDPGIPPSLRGLPAVR